MHLVGSLYKEWVKVKHNYIIINMSLYGGRQLTTTCFGHSGHHQVVHSLREKLSTICNNNRNKKITKKTKTKQEQINKNKNQNQNQKTPKKLKKPKKT